ncbi:hypothetical protein V1514DRAFT_344550 [Lipomyces japonicus]|uniref:uncharacterized protein n=1 Tax=Lipomyces japonicus TaxID=56871 RepID=UPI0034D016CA
MADQGLTTLSDSDHSCSSHEHLNNSNTLTRPMELNNKAPTRLPGLLSLPDELFEPIFMHLDIPDLLALSRTTQRLRRLSLDSHIQKLRLKYFAGKLVSHLLARPTEKDLLARHILRSPLSLSHRFHAVATNLHMAFAQNSLQRKLSIRPQLNDLIQKGVYPATDARVSPVLAMRCKSLERNKLRDVLESQLRTRVWERIKKSGRSIEKGRQESVNVLVDRIQHRKDVTNISCRSMDTPPRAKVYRLRMYFERVIALNQTMSVVA